MPAELTRLTKQAEQRPEYCAYLLRRYLNEHTAYTLNDLAQLLRCAPDRLPLLWLSERPGERWGDDVDHIARSIGCDRDVLAQLLQAALELIRAGMSPVTYRVLVVGELEGNLPLIPLWPAGLAPLHSCGLGYEGDFSGNSGQGCQGEVWEFTTDQPELMEQCLQADPAVVAFKRL